MALIKNYCSSMKRMPVTMVVTTPGRKGRITATGAFIVSIFAFNVCEMKRPRQRAVKMWVFMSGCAESAVC